MGRRPESSEPAAQSAIGGAAFDNVLALVKDFAGGFAVGNRWYKCNLHVHGQAMDPVRLVEESLKQGLDFIAITDHQTFSSVERAVHAAGDKIVVAPGMEITTQEGSHILAIFPSGYSPDKQTKFLGFLEVSGTGDTSQASRRTVKEVFNKVNEEGGLIVVPHPFANKTGLLDSARKLSTKIEWLESGFVRLIQAPEDKIQYVAWDEDGRWVNRFVLASATPDQIQASSYCFAPINVSDCYQADKIGEGATWFRMGELSIEGLKQVACEPAARISKAKPPDDAHPAILAVRVTGGYCDRQTFMFNSGLNCIVGPNHSGKSAVFDFIRFALGMDDAGSPDARAILLARLNAILQGGSSVELLLRHAENGYLVRRVFRPETVFQGGVLKVARATEASKWFLYDTESQTLEPVDPIPFPVEVYEQGRIHRLRDDIPRQLEMLDEFAGLQALRGEQDVLVNKLNVSADELEPLKSRRDRLILEFAELPALQKELADKQALMPKDDEQQSWAAGATAASSIAGVVNTVVTLSERVETPLSRPAWEDEEDPIWALFNQKPPDFDRVKPIHTDLFDRWMNALEGALTKLDVIRPHIRTASETLRQESDAIEADWKRYQEDHERELSRELAKAGVDSPQELLNRVGELRRKIHELESVKKPQLAELEADVKRKEAARVELLPQLEEGDRQIREKRALKAKELTDALDGHIQISLTLFGDRREYKKLLMELYGQIASKELQIKNIDAQLSLVADKLTPRQLAQALMQKGVVPKGAGSTAELTSFCSITQNTQNVLCAIADNVRLLNRLQTAPTPDVLKISVKRQGETVYADLSTGLSPGEQSAALLTLALQTRAIPLVIDQPEDELGYNYVVNLIVPKILQAKLRRQMLVISHNANVPVLGDADFVVKMQNNPSPAGGRQCVIAEQGCFESSAITATLMELEGGRRAFELRQHRYALGDRNVH
ncbi:MAG: AAA family ATPase [Bryobacteraceae bacterium]|jgi:DNA repair ATPase RecN